MKNLFIARHGDYDMKNGQLTDEGRRKVAVLGGKIKTVTKTGSLHIMSSPAVRAYQSAEVLAGILGVAEIERVPYLGSDPDLEGSFSEFEVGSLNKMTNIVNSRINKADSVVMVTHYEVCKYFSPHYAKISLGFHDPLRELEKSEAFYFNLERKSVGIL